MIRKLNALRKNQSFMKYFNNTSWMFVEQGIKVVSAVFVGIYIARYLGPEQFGLLSYAIAIVAIFMAISRLGMESILVRELVNQPEKMRQYMGTAFSLMFIAAILGIGFISGIVSLTESDPQTKLYIWIISIGLIFQTFLEQFGLIDQVVVQHFAGQVLAKSVVAEEDVFAREIAEHAVRPVKHRGLYEGQLFSAQTEPVSGFYGNEIPVFVEMSLQ